jgi:RNA exonuclease 4
MAPIELSNLSSNWKKLQKTLQPATSTAKSTSEGTSQHSSLKRKRSTNTDGEHAYAVKKDLKGSENHIRPKFGARKRYKMEEPASIGASMKHSDSRALNRSISMPSIKQATLLADPKAASQSISTLVPSPDHPDIENEGASTTALPGKYIALDCEMVGTGPEPDRDSALARVSVVNYHGHQVYDSYVQVKVPVTDYRTKISGIEPRHIKRDVARTFKDVQDDLKTLLAGRILVGHAVKNDLDALLIKHEKRYMRDTSKFSKFRELSLTPGRTPGLKYLVGKLLGVEIQTGAHSSVEDARATMALFRLEKDAFEEEVRRLYGQVAPVSAAANGETKGDDAPKKKNKKKKKKKNN